MSTEPGHDDDDDVVGGKKRRGRGFHRKCASGECLYSLQRSQDWVQICAQTPLIAQSRSSQVTMDEHDEGGEEHG